MEASTTDSISKIQTDAQIEPSPPQRTYCNQKNSRLQFLEVLLLIFTFAQISYLVIYSSLTLKPTSYDIVYLHQKVDVYLNNRVFQFGLLQSAFALDKNRNMTKFAEEGCKIYKVPYNFKGISNGSDLIRNANWTDITLCIDDRSANYSQKCPSNLSRSDAKLSSLKTRIITFICQIIFLVVMITSILLFTVSKPQTLLKLYRVFYHVIRLQLHLVVSMATILNLQYFDSFSESCLLQTSSGQSLTGNITSLPIFVFILLCVLVYSFEYFIEDRKRNIQKLRAAFRSLQLYLIAIFACMSIIVWFGQGKYVIVYYLKLALVIMTMYLKIRMVKREINPNQTQ